MPNGKPGDSPLSDMLVHGLHPFPPDMETLLREVLRLRPNFPRWAIHLRRAVGVDAEV